MLGIEDSIVLTFSSCCHTRSGSMSLRCVLRSSCYPRSHWGRAGGSFSAIDHLQAVKHNQLSCKRTGAAIRFSPDYQLTSVVTSPAQWRHSLVNLFFLVSSVYPACLRFCLLCLHSPAVGRQSLPSASSSLTSWPLLLLSQSHSSLVCLPTFGLFLMDLRLFSYFSHHPNYTEYQWRLGHNHFMETLPNTFSLDSLL